jgi:oxygen-independent coproporphyrinogen-3 oxidase
MNIAILFANASFEKEVQVICRMFFENPQVTFDLQTEADLQIELQMGEGDPISIRAIAKIGTEQWEASHVRHAPFATDSKEWRKKAKQVLSYVLIEVLEQATGIEQPWGILTGIRPTKLFHSMLRLGNTPAQIETTLVEDYLLSREKTKLLRQIASAQHQALPDFYQLNEKEVSIYIGIPFCPTKCAYCTFPAYAIDNNVDAFLEGLHYEVMSIGQWLQEKGLGLTTIYLGGGTPTSITAKQMDELFQQMDRYFPARSGIRELTVEAGRPDTITPEKLEVMKKWQVDRISINPQSFTEETLQAIGRDHSVNETIEKYHLARAMGLNNINMDLIIGLPGEGEGHFLHSLAETAKLMPESLTVHTLSFKRASTMTKQKEAYAVASRDEIRQMLQITKEWTGQFGYSPYYLYRQKNILGNMENVGYALPGKESLYNIIIMEEIQTILGLGCGAVSKLIEPVTGAFTRYPNPKDPLTYIQTYEQLVHKKLAALEETYKQLDSGLLYK